MRCFKLQQNITDHYLKRDMQIGKDHDIITGEWLLGDKAHVTRRKETNDHRVVN